MLNIWRNSLKQFSLSKNLINKQRGATSELVNILEVYKKFLNSNMDNSLLPPSVVRGMKLLDKELFNKNVQVPCVIIPSKIIQLTTKHLKKYILKLQNFKPIDTASQSLIDKLKEKGILLQEEFKMAVLNPLIVKTFNDILENDRLKLKRFGITKNNFFFIDICLNYDNWKADEILRAVIPTEYDAVSGYSLIGHIVHLNLREHLIEYKYLIGLVLLDKIKNAKTVVNKANIIDNTYRNFNMELLCGEDNMITEVKENKCNFKFDFSKVYWNPRLSTEHERITDILKEGDVFYDVFAGVGPFSIPAAKKGCITLCNDLNPDSIHWLKTNITLNKIKNNITVFNKDGLDFIKQDIKNHLLSLKPGKYTIHIAMNLPGLATTFLPAFKNLFSEDEMELIRSLSIPKLYIYTFAKGLENCSDLAIKAVEDSYGERLTNDIEDVFFVRDVAPNKKMMRVTLLLSENILNNKKRSLSQEFNVKRICI